MMVVSLQWEDLQDITMKALIIAVFTLLITSGASLADTSASRFRVENGRIVVAQSYCRMCADDRTYCVTKCNGAGTCIQNCDYDFQLCRERNCQYRR
jgi:hypothetical protein